MLDKVSCIKAAVECEFIAQEIQEAADCCTDLQQRLEILAEMHGALRCAKFFLEEAQDQ